MARARRIADAVRCGRPWPFAVDRRPEDRRAEYAVRRLTGTGARVADVAEEAGLSERQLRRLILSRTGLEPRTLRRVARLQRYLTLSDRAGTLPGPERSLAGLAAAAGYADQAHLSREVRALAGLTPSGLLAERRASGGGAAPGR